MPTWTVTSTQGQSTSHAHAGDPHAACPVALGRRQRLGVPWFVAMTSWRDGSSALAQDDLDGLLNAVLPLAEDLLGKHFEFFPFGRIRFDRR